MKPRPRSLIVVASLLLVWGCAFSPNRVQYPTIGVPSEEAQRRAAQIQDPYPDATIGPPVDARPRGFLQQRSEPQQTKDRFYSGFLKSHFGGPTPKPAPAPGTSAVPPMIGPAAYGPGYYPGIVQ
ncbi:hypothetical protein [Planctomicrobium piriforme]|uniref:Uncharacterized protein n=1 Tax=Planctomicrobium piriforme TaxID=1576369 RepID=A0A1I3M7K1_9PLAN|nr:hypothetical protein [Planctomicrobium piriforme]SFI92715.1 hypothetical protein SAMN05421753_113178 [Planctomicrobium piriforme]